MKIIEEAFYLSDGVEAVNRLVNLSGDMLSPEEIEEVVGRFAKHSSRAGQLRGEVVKYIDGSLVIRHHFTKKKIWED